MFRGIEGFTNEYLRDVEKTVTLFLHAIEKFYGQRTFGSYIITPAQFNLLRYTYLNRDISIGTIARDLSISYPAASNAADRLAAKGLVKRLVDVRDRRQIRLTITPRGEKLFREISQSINQEFLKTLRAMNEEDIKGMMNGLASFIKVLITEGDMKVDEVCLKCGTEHTDECLMEKLREGTYNTHGKGVNLHAREN